MLIIDSIVRGEHDENELRKDFTPSERVAIGRELEAALGNRQGERTDKHPANLPEVKGAETRELAAQKAGFDSATTYRNAKDVVDKGTPELQATRSQSRA